jgi:hypothetical protein
LALLDPVALVDCQVHDAARRVGADLHETLRLDFSRRGHDGLEIAGFHDLGADRESLVLLEVEVRADHGCGDQHDPDDDEHVLTRHRSTLLRVPS